MSDVRLSVIGDIDGMNVGALRKLLDDISDESVIEEDKEG